MTSFATSILVSAPAATIWTVLTDASAYPAWSSTIDKIVGRIGAGERIRIYDYATPGRGFAVTVTELVPGKRMVWTGGLPLGLFTGRRTFTLTPRPDGRVQLSIGEAFSGPLCFYFLKTMPDLQPELEQLAADLKARAESDDWY